MKLHIRGLLAISVFVLLGSGQSLAQNAYITNYSDSTVSVIDISANTLVTTIPVANNPYAVAVSPKDNRAYITHPGAVSVIDTTANKVLSTILVGTGATGTCLSTVVCTGIAVTPGGDQVFVGNRGLNSVSAINTKNMAITVIPVGSYPFGIAVTPNGSKVYVATTNGQDIFPPPTSGGIVSVINAANDKVIATIPVGGNPLGVAVSPDGDRVYVVNNGSGTLSVISTENQYSDSHHFGYDCLQYIDGVSFWCGCSARWWARLRWYR